MSVEEIIRIASLSASLFISLIGAIITLIGWIKTAIKNKNWTVLRTELQNFVSKAESFANFTGVEKKEIVLAWTANFCNSKGIKFDVEKVSAEIEELVALTKKVNQREKDKQVEQNKTIEEKSTLF